MDNSYKLYLEEKIVDMETFKKKAIIHRDKCPKMDESYLNFNIDVTHWMAKKEAFEDALRVYKDIRH